MDPRQNFLSHGPLFWTPRPIFHDFLKTKKMRNVRTINLAVVSRRDLCCVSENESFVLSKTSGFPDADAAAADAAADGRTLRSQPDPSPNAPRDQIRRKGPCCDRKAIIIVHPDKMKEADPEKQGADAQDALKALIEVALETSQLEKFTGRSEPTVIT